MNSQLVPVFDGTISNESALLCNARDLHKFLEVGRDFSNWIRERISEYGFIANLDYTEFSPNSAKTGGRRRKEYHLTLDTAKELAMVERNEKGRQVRRYFIECEKRLRNETNQSQDKSKTICPAISVCRYQAIFIIRDLITGKKARVDGEADTLKAIAEGIATDLGYKPVATVLKNSEVLKILSE